MGPAVQAHLKTPPEVTDNRPFYQKILTSPVDLGAGIVEGLLQDPLLNYLSPVHLAYNSIASHYNLPSTRMLATQIEEATKGRKLSDIGELIGELAPSFALGGGLFSLGRAAAVKALEWTAVRTAGVALPEALEAGLSSVRMRAALDAADTPVLKGALERGAEVAGGAVGAGVAGGIESASRGQSVTQGALLGAGLAAGTEGALIGAGKLFGFGTEFNAGAIEQRLFGSKEYAAAKDAVSAAGTKRLETLTAAYGKAVNVRDQLDELLRYGTPDEQAVFNDAEDAVREGAMSVRQQESANAATARLIDPDRPTPNQYTTDQPYNPEGRRLMMAQLFSKAIERPAGFLRKMGVTGVRLLQDINAAEHESTIGRSLDAAFIKHFRQDAAELMGVSRFTQGGKWMLPLVDAYEKGGVEGAAAYFGSDTVKATKAADLFNRISDLSNRYQAVVKLGAEPAMTSDELASQGVKAFWPHMPRPLSDDEMYASQVASLVRGGMDKAAAEIKVATDSLTSSESRQGLRQFTSQDHRRGVVGSLADKLAQGAPLEEDPLHGLERYLNGITVSEAYAKRFGYGYESRQQMKNAVLMMTKAEGGSVPLMNGMVDSMLFDKYYNQALRQTVQGITSWQTAAKLPFAVIGNMTGGALAPMMMGTRNTLMGLKQLLSSVDDRNHLWHVLGLNESLFGSLRRSYMGQTLTDNVIDKVSDGVLTATGFNAAEKFNRLLSGAAANQAIMDDIARASAGTLRGNTLDAARRRWAEMGLDLTSATKGVRAELSAGSDLKTALRNVLGSQYDEAVYNGAMKVQGIPTKTARPVAWATPVGRLLTQFKSFALNQGVLTRDAVLKEAALGNPVPLAYMASAYPIAGDFAIGTRAAIKGDRRKQTGFQRYIDDMAAVGGLGLTHQFLQSLQHGDLDGFLLGPSYTDAKKALGALYQLTFDQKTDQAEKFVKQQPLYQAIKRLYDGGEGMFASDVDAYAKGHQQ